MDPPAPEQEPMVGRGILLRLAEFCGPQSHGDGAVFAPFSTLRSGAAFWIALARGALPTGRPGRKDFGLTPPSRPVLRG
jgi:hypothetical protein